MHFSLNLNRSLEIACLMAVCSVSYGSYGIPASTGSGLPYSVETRNLVKDLFDNRTIVGGQVIALKDQPGKSYSGNYLDIGALAGVKTGDIFAFFTPQGEPVGFGRIIEVQRYTASFSFIELTVDPTDNLIGKKVTQELKLRLSTGKTIDLPMGRFKKSVIFLSRKHKSVAPPNISIQGAVEQNNALSEQSTLPPLPGDSNTTTEPNTALGSVAPNNGSALPELPMDNTGAGSISATPSSGSDLPPLNTDDNNLPALPGTDSNSNALPPLSDSSALPGMAHSDNSSANIPPLSDSGDTGSSLPSLTMGDTTTASIPEAGLPGMDNGGGLPPANSSTLPGMDNGGLPPATEAASLPGMTDTTMAAAPGIGLPGMDNGGGLPPANSSTLPGMDNGGLPPASETASLPGMTDTTMAAAPGIGLPGMDNSGGLPPPMANNSLLPVVSADNALPSTLPAPDGALPQVDSTVPTGFPPITMGSLPPAMDMNGGQVAPPDVSVTAPPMVANAVSAPAQSSPADNYQPSDLGIPSVPSKVNSGYLQDIPTLSSSKKPAA